MSTIQVGELLYEVTRKITGMTEYGVSFEALIAGKVGPPPEGARFDVAFEGAASGPKLKGLATGVDYVRVRADGRFDLHIHETISAENGQKIDVQADGVAFLRRASSIADLRLNLTLFTSAKDYTWVNALQVWGIGTVDLAEQVIQVTAYSA
jgi:hypothetical protein